MLCCIKVEIPSEHVFGIILEMVRPFDAQADHIWMSSSRIDRISMWAISSDLIRFRHHNAKQTEYRNHALPLGDINPDCVY